jgi:hypothetical protein
MRTGDLVRIVFATVLAASSCKDRGSPAENGAPGSSVQAASRRTEAPPIDAARYAFSPSFVTNDGPVEAGKAVPIRAAKAPGGVAVVSCNHIFGPPGKLRRIIPGEAMASFVQQGMLADLDGQKTPFGPALSLPGARPFSASDASTDLSLFYAPESLASRALDLAASGPAVNDDVWLLARLVDGALPSDLLHRARVVSSDDKMLVYEFDSPSLQLRATSGAPVVNARGQIVGLNLGARADQGKLVAFGNPVSSVERQIDRALAAAK